MYVKFDVASEIILVIITTIGANITAVFIKIEIL